MKKKKVIGISVITVLIVAVLVASYVLIVIPRRNEAVVSEETANVETGEKVQAGEVSTEGWDLSKVNIVYDTEGVPVPVPKGYVASSVEGEHTVNDGFVIYEGDEEVNGVSTDSSVLEAQKTRNQWVWVPIYDPSEIYGVDENGMMHGKLYDYDDAGRIAKNWTENNGVIKLSMREGYREPDIVKYSDNDRSLPDELVDEDRKDLNIELRENFEKSIESIKKYGGFYIGRYETGGLNGEAKVVRADKNISQETWYTMYEKSKKLRGINKNVETSMIWGCLWDATLEWLVDSGDKTYSEVGTDSTSWGNYSVSGHGSKRPTGYSENWKANNIYDMAGNVYDWTLEAYVCDKRVYRGGSYYDYGYSAPVADDIGGGPKTRTTSLGGRALLYVEL